jgi:rod shape-determining protein MreB
VKVTALRDCKKRLRKVFLPFVEPIGFCFTFECIMFKLFNNHSFAIDLGNNNTIISDESGPLFSQPSYIVFNTAKNVRAIGDHAYAMFEKTHEELTSVKPLKGGVIADFESATLMIQEMVKQVYKKQNFFSGFDHVISGIPYNTTEVERRALRDALEQINSKKSHLIYEPLAAALGMGLNIREPQGKLVIDIGGGITEIVVISLSGIAAFRSVKVAGDTFDENIQDHLRKNYNLAVGLKTAEQVKIQVGAVTAKLIDPPQPMFVKGKDMISGIPVTRKIDHTEVAHILEKSISQIETAIIQTLETCPPELAADIYETGIHLTGGGSLLGGIQSRLEKRMRLKVITDRDPLRSVSRGISYALASPEKFRSILI